MAISFVNSADFGDNGGSGTLTGSYTVGSGTSRLLVVVVMGDNVGGVDAVNAPTYNGMTMTLAAKQTASGDNRMLYQYFLLNPASGSHTLTITQSSPILLAAVVSDYAGVQQVSQPDVTTTNVSAPASNSLTTSITTVTDNCWTIIAENGYAGTLSAGTGTTFRVKHTAYVDEPSLFDSNAAIHPAGTYSMTTNRTGAATVITHVIAAYKPDTGATTLMGTMLM